MFKKYRQQVFILIGVVLAALLFVFNPLQVDVKAAKVFSIAFLVIFLWITEALPMAVTAMLPLILFPITDVMSAKETAKSYGDTIIFLFMGGFFLGLAIEKWNLHKRIALNIVRLSGTNGNSIILGFIMATGGISMWLSNTATTMMLFPIASSVILVMKENNTKGNQHNFAIALMLVIAYASNLGGIATIIGTPPNVAYVGFIKDKLHHSINFFDWIKLCMPLSVLLLLMLYLVVTKFLYPNEMEKSEATANYIQQELKTLGKISKTEKRVLFIFSFTAFLWITQGIINKLFAIKLDDAIIAIIGATLLFATPSGTTHEDNTSIPILVWKDTQKMAWGILILFGGGLALAKGLEEAGLIQLLGNILADIAPENLFLLILLITTFSVFISEVMSNVAQVIIFSPVVTALAISLHINPLYLGIPMCLGASCAGMLPMGTPPNAIAFSSGQIALKDMLKTGFIMNIISILFISVACYFLLPLLMELM
ncbi:MAG: DASS family sodium-coupled anion symporter [Chitinophagales bacterium]